MEHIFTHLEIETQKEAFIKYFAKEYIAQRTANLQNLQKISNHPLIEKNGFDVKRLLTIIQKGSVVNNLTLNLVGKLDAKDIIRSELGELLLTYYFEKKVAEKERFSIPIKLIEVKEVAGMASRGIDAIGFRKEGEKIHLLVGEAKVSDEKKNPPQVAAQIYETQKALLDKNKLLHKLGDFVKKLAENDAETLSFFILAMDYDRKDLYTITFGCTLVRDVECADIDKDFGKMKQSSGDFASHFVHFAILFFKDDSIENTVKRFFAEIQNY